MPAPARPAMPPPSRCEGRHRTHDPERDPRPSFEDPHHARPADHPARRGLRRRGGHDAARGLDAARSGGRLRDRAVAVRPGGQPSALRGRRGLLLPPRARRGRGAPGHRRGPRLPDLRRLGRRGGLPPLRPGVPGPGRGGPGRRDPRRGHDRRGDLDHGLLRRPPGLLRPRGARLRRERRHRRRRGRPATAALRGRRVRVLGRGQPPRGRWADARHRRPRRGGGGERERGARSGRLRVRAGEPARRRRDAQLRRGRRAAPADRGPHLHAAGLDRGAERRGARDRRRDRRGPGPDDRGRDRGHERGSRLRRPGARSRGGADHRPHHPALPHLPHRRGDLRGPLGDRRGEPGPRELGGHRRQLRQGHRGRARGLRHLRPAPHQRGDRPRGLRQARLLHAGRHPCARVRHHRARDALRRGSGGRLRHPRGGDLAPRQHRDPRRPRAQPRRPQVRRAGLPLAQEHQPEPARGRGSGAVPLLRRGPQP